MLTSNKKKFEFGTSAWCGYFECNISTYSFEKKFEKGKENIQIYVNIQDNNIWGNLFIENKYIKVKKIIIVVGE